MALSLHGRPAGEQSWSVTPEKHAWLVRVQTDFGGVLPAVRRVQTSRLHPRSLTSLAYQETDGARGKVYDATFDRKSGLATLRLGRDEASMPLLEDHHDPVSIVMWLRGLTDDRAEARLLGGRVHVQRLANSEVDGVRARTFLLRPGGATVTVEADAPNRLLHMIQPTDFGPIEASLRGRAPRRERERAPDPAPRRRRR